MGNLLVSVVLPQVSGVLKDQVVQDFVFITPTTPATTAEASSAGSALIAFYNTAQTSGSTVANFLSTVLDRGANRVQLKYYHLDSHLDGTPHGSPFFMQTFTLGASQGGETNLPSEVAGVLSYHSNLTDVLIEAGSTRPASRHKGRVYLGPLDTLARSIETTTNKPQLSALFRTTVTQAAAALIVVTAVTWAQWSRVDQITRVVVGGFVDNGFDTQRRRGEAANSRTTFGA